jgi:hypothetical protein
MNPVGAVVVRQEGEWDDDADHPFLVIRPENLALLIAALQQYLLE